MKTTGTVARNANLRSNFISCQVLYKKFICEKFLEQLKIFFCNIDACYIVNSHLFINLSLCVRSSVSPESTVSAATHAAEKDKKIVLYQTEKHQLRRM